MEQLRVVAENHVVGRLHPHLSHIVDFQPPPLVRGGLDPRLGVGQHGVEHPGGNSGGRLVVHVLDELKEPVHPLARGGGDEEDGGVGHIGEIPPDLLPHPVHGFAVLLDEVPLIDHDDAGLTGLVGHTGHLGVLLGDALLGVDEDEAHVRPLDGHLGPEHAVALDGLVHLGLFAHAGGVDEDVLPGLVLEIAVDGVPGGAGHVADDGPLLSQDLVGQGGLAHVGLADDGHLDPVLVLLVLPLGGEVPHALVQQVPGAVAVEGGDGHGVPQPQVVELVEVRVRRAGGIHLVHCQHNGLAAAQQHGGHLLVRGGEPGLDVGEEDDHVRVAHGDAGLLAHEGEDFAVGAGLDAPGVDEGKFPSVPVGLAVDTVARNAGGVLHDGDSLPDQLVEQGGFAHVGAADDGDNWFWHGLTPSSRAPARGEWFLDFSASSLRGLSSLRYGRLFVLRSTLGRQECLLLRMHPIPAPPLSPAGSPRSTPDSRRLQRVCWNKCWKRVFSSTD